MTPGRGVSGISLFDGSLMIRWETKWGLRDAIDGFIVSYLASVCGGREI